MIKKHYLAVIMAIFVGLLAVAPHLFFAFAMADRYGGINILKSSDEEAYLADVQTVVAGHKNFSFPYLIEYKDIVPSLVSIPEIVLGNIALWTGAGADNLFLLLKFFAPFIVFLFIYWLVYVVSRDKIAALLAPSLTIVGMGIVGAGYSIIKNVILWRGPVIEFWDWVRLLNPAFSGIFFILALLSVFYLFIKPRFWVALLAGLTFGLLFYIYLYFWTFIFVLLSAIFIYALGSRRVKDALYYFLALMSGVIIGIPQLLRLLGLLNEFSLGAGGFLNTTTVGSHAPIFEKVVIVSLSLYILFLIYLYRRKELNNILLFPLFLLITSFIAVNQQVITGKSIQPFHYYFYTDLPSAYIALAVIFGYVINLIRQKYLKYSVVAAVFLLIFSWGIGVQVSSYKYWAPRYEGLQNYGAIFDWFELNAAKDSVIYGNDEISDLIPAYTPFFVYWNNYAGDSPYPPMARKESAYFVRMRLLGLDGAAGAKYLSARRDDVGLKFFGQYYRGLCGSYGCFSDEIMNNFISDYKDFLKKSFEQEFKKYKADYFVWDTVKNPDWRVADLKFLTPVYEYRGIRVFAVN